MFRRIISIIILSLVVSAAGGAARAQKNPKKLAEATKHSQEAAEVFTEIMNISDKAIPQGLLNKAEAGHARCQGFVRLVQAFLHRRRASAMR